MTTNNDTVIQDIRDAIQRLSIAESMNRQDIQYVKENIDSIEAKLDKISSNITIDKQDLIKDIREEFVKYVEFSPVKQLVYGMVGGILLSVLGVFTSVVLVPSATDIFTVEKPNDR